MKPGSVFRLASRAAHAKPLACMQPAAYGRRQVLACGLRWVGLPGLVAALAVGVPRSSPAQADADFEGDPLQSHAWPDMRREFLGRQARVIWDARVRVEGPRFAEDPMNVPISVRVDPALGSVEEIVVLVDRNPIRKVLSYEPQQALPRIAFRFKLEQGSPVRAAVRSGGIWYVGSTFVDSSGGGCTVSGATRADGSWSRTLGNVSGGLFTPTPDTTRLRVRVMHPMDTGLVAGVPAFYLSRLTLRDAQDRELARLASFEPVSENPVFSFDFARSPEGGVFIVGTDNNGNRIRSRVQ
jgi:sulfur-oxidizing protein SoxY